MQRRVNSRLTIRCTPCRRPQGLTYCRPGGVVETDASSIILSGVAGCLYEMIDGLLAESGVVRVAQI